MTVTECARVTHDTGNVASVTVPITAAVAAGQRLILAVNGAALNAATGFTATDSKGNTYTQRAFAICSVAPGTTATAAQDAELLIAVLGFTDSGAARTLTMAGWTQLTKATASPSSSPKSMILAYQYVSASGSRAGSGTLSASEAWVGAIAAYKQDAAAPATFCWLYNGTDDIPMDITVA
jgi:hypothetical protein